MACTRLAGSAESRPRSAAGSAGGRPVSGSVGERLTQSGGGGEAAPDDHLAAGAHEHDGASLPCLGLSGHAHEDLYNTPCSNLISLNSSFLLGHTGGEI